MAKLFESVRRRLRDESGIALVMAVGILAVTSASLTSLIYYTGANSRSSSYAKAEQNALALAEAGVNNALAVLSVADDVEDGGLLPPRTNTYEGGHVEWSGYIDEQWRWVITSTGVVKNPTGPGAADVRRTIVTRIQMKLPETTTLVTPIWNWIYSARTGNVCDTTLDQSIELASPLYVVGNLCLRSTAKIVKGPLVVEGRVLLEQPHNAIGSSTTPIDAAHVGNGCQYQNHGLYLPCVFQSTDPKAKTNIWASTVWSDNPIRIPPVEWDEWYRYASPGPKSPCSFRTGTPPTFEVAGDTARNNNVPGYFNLTPAGSSYQCRTRRGELSWNHVDKVLTVRGTIFIDGSARVESGLVTSYDAQSAVYLSGTLLIKNSKLCAVLTADKTDCDQAGWDPNTRMIVFAADGTGGQVSAGNSIEIVSSTFQGALYGTGAVQASTTSKTQGPEVALEVMIGQSNNVSFPKIEIVPAGMPGNPIPKATLEQPEFG